MIGNPNNARREALRVAAGESIIRDAKVTLYLIERRIDQATLDFSREVQKRVAVRERSLSPATNRYNTPDTIQQHTYDEYVENYGLEPVEEPRPQLRPTLIDESVYED